MKIRQQSDNQDIQHHNRSISRSGFKVGLGSIFSLAAGLLSQATIAAIFGAGQDMDVLLTAMTVPLYIQSVLLAGVSFVFVPAFIEDIEKGQEDEAWALVGTFFWIITAVLTAITALVIIFAESIVATTAPGMDAEKANTTVNLLQLIIFVTPFQGLAMFSGSIQNARSRFFWPSVRGAFASLANMLTVVLLYRWQGVMALGWGYLMAGVVESTFTVIPVARHGWPHLLSLRDQRVIRTFQLLIPFILFGIFTRLTPIIERFFASGLPDGQLSYLGYSDRIAKTFYSLIGVTIVTTTFPAMSRAYSKHGHSGMLKIFEYGARLTLATAVPVVAIVSATAVPLVMVLFERGAFDHAATLSVASILPIVILRAILITMLGNLFTRVFYTAKNTYLVPIVSAGAVLVYIPLASWGAQRWGYVGLAWAEAVYALLGLVILGILIGARYRTFPIRRMLRHAFVYGFPALVAFGVASLIVAALSDHLPIVQLVSGGALGGVAYMLVLFVLDNDIAQALLELFGLHKLRRLTHRRPAQPAADL